MGINSYLGKFFDFLFPVRCEICKNTGFYLCNICRTKLPRAKEPAQKEIEAIFDYKTNEVRKIIWKLKYKNIRELSKIFGEILYEHMLPKLGELALFDGNKKFILVPIPLSREKLRSRGFNQMDLIAKEIENLDKGESLEYSSNILIKIRDTKPQMEIKKREERLKNVIGSFAVSNKNRVLGKSIIIIDDVTTTGATLMEARKELLLAGAKSVWAIAIAH